MTLRLTSAPAQTAFERNIVPPPQPCSFRARPILSTSCVGSAPAYSAYRLLSILRRGVGRMRGMFVAGSGVAVGASGELW